MAVKVSKKQAAGVAVVILTALVATLKQCPEDTTVAPESRDAGVTTVDAGAK